MTITLMDGFEDYGVKLPDSPGSSGFGQVGRTPAKGGDPAPKARVTLSHRDTAANYDVTPPADGQWHTVSMILKRDPDGTLWMMKAPETKPWTAIEIRD